MNARKLLLHEKVEVRQIEDGLQGSWYSAVVIAILDMSREVKYDELLCETEDSRLVETVPVTGEIEGVYQRPCVKTNHRGRIRPQPPSYEASSVKAKLRFGFCVDVLFEDAWWEGVIFDNNDGSGERSVYFPDEGDKQIVKVSDLRITHEWDEFSGIWKERGVWTLVKLADESQISDHLAKFVEFVWSHLRANYGFHKMISEWTCGAYSLWKTYFMEVTGVLSTRSLHGAICYPIASQVAEVRWRGKKSKRCQWPKPNNDGSLSTKTSHRRDERKVCQSIKSKQYDLRRSKVGNSSVHGVDSNIPQTDVLSKKGQRTSARGGSSHEGEISDVCSVQTNERIENAATTSGRSARDNKKQSRPQVVLSRRKVQLLKNNSEPQDLNPFVVHQEQLHGFRDTPQKHKNVSSGLCSLLHVKKTRHPIRGQTGGNTATRFPRCYQRVVSFNLRRKRSCLKVNKRYPKKLRRSSAKRRVSCTKDGSHSELKQQKEKSLDVQAASQQELEPQDTIPEVESHRSKKSRKNDTFCFVCHYGEDLVPCDNCTSSYHMSCIGIKEVPSGYWFCPSCRCGFCGLRDSGKDDLFTEVCYQCSRQYHLDCLINKTEDALPDKFCSKKCFEICARLHDYLQALYSTPVEGLSWTLVRSRRNDYNIRDERIHPHVQLSEVMKVLHECFEPTIEPHSKKDLVVEVVYNSSSKFKRLDFHGFYVMVLLQGEEIASVATLRIHGHKVAEMPLVATPFKYRRKGMCRLLVREMEKMLIALGVERLVLPAISQLRETWINAFGFEEMPVSLREELAGYPFLVFSGTTMFHKVLCESNLTEYTSHVQETKSNTAGVSQEHEDNCRKRRGLCYKLRQRPENVNRDQTTKQKLNCSKCLRPETRRQEIVMTKGLCQTRRRRLEDVGEKKTRRQGADTDSSPVNNVYKRRRVLATREDVH